MKKQIKMPLKFNPGIQAFEPDLTILKNIVFREELIKKIIEKKEFSDLPRKDVELAFFQFDKAHYLDEEKVKLTRDLLRKVFSGFTSLKLLNLRDKSPEWILKKHLSTRERFPFYKKIYGRILNREDYVIFDLGAGVNGFSYGFFPNKTNYIGVEAVGQLVNLMNYFFKINKLNAKAIHESLFELDKIEKLLKEKKGHQIIFLFKTLDSLEMLQRDYSKTLLKKITPLTERVVVSFATRSMNKREKFKAKRNWIIYFIKDNFNVLDDFEEGGERYIVFCKKD